MPTPDDTPQEGELMEKPATLSARRDNCSMDDGLYVDSVWYSCKIKKMKEGMTQTYTKQHEFDYTYIQGRNLVAEVEVQYENWIAIGKVEWISDLNYPLMYVKEVKQV